MTQKETLLYYAARAILFNHCPPDQKYYFCKKFPDETEETKCEECWNNYLLDILNGKVELNEQV